MNKLTIALVGLALAGAQPAAAGVTNSLPGGVPQVMPNLGDAAFTAGPVTFGDTTYSSTDSESVLGWSGGYSFGPNGTWSGVPMAGLNTAVGTMTFAFDHTLFGVLADLNWAVPGASDGNPIYMIVYDSSFNPLEGIFLASGSANYQSPGAWGFIRPEGDIAYLTLSNGYIGAKNFETLGGAVPEPATWALMLLGFGAAGVVLRNRRQALAAA